MLSPGYDTFDPKIRGDYGYGTYQNVVTSLDFERLLSATGPHEGHILRPSDRKHPHKIAWLHCVGSRQTVPGGNTYCSAVCCAYTQKQVILAKDHVPDLEARVFHNDIRAYSKDFERFYQRAVHDPALAGAGAGAAGKRLQQAGAAALGRSRKQVVADFDGPGALAHGNAGQ